MSKIVTFSPQAREDLIKGVNILGDAVGSTLGPKGRNVVIDVYGVPHVTKDGVTVAKAITLIEPVQRLGADIVKQAAQRTARNAGDGTTTATVIAQALINNGISLIKEGTSPIDIKRLYESLLQLSLDSILKQSKPVTLSNIKQIATISANNDEQIGSLIHEGFTFVGLNGVMSVEDSKTGETYVSTTSGAHLRTGLVSPYFITDPIKQECIQENPLILLTDKKLRTKDDIVPVMELGIKLNRPVLIICDEIEAEALAIAVFNRLKANFPIAVIKAPGFADRRADILNDLGILLNGEVISNIKSTKLKDIKEFQLGSAEKVIISQEKTIIIGPQGDESKIATRLEEIQNLLSNPDNNDYIIEKLNERYANLSSKVAILSVGASTETELKEKKDRIDDALRATKSAIALGYVPGGGDTLLKTAFTLKLNSEDADPISQAFGKALVAPYELIIKNASLTFPHYSTFMEGPNNVNALTGEIVNLEEAGIIDPTLVVTEALTNAVSAANMVLLSEVTIHDTKPKYQPEEF